MLGNGQSHRTRKFVTITFYKIIKCLLGIELGIKILRHRSIERRRSLVATRRGLRMVDTHCLARLYIGGETVCLVGHNTIGEPHSRTETFRENTAQQVNIILLQVLIYIRTWNLHQKRLVLFGEGLEDDR